MKRQLRYVRDSGEVPVEGKNASAVLQSNGRNQGVNRGEGNAFCARCPVVASSIMPRNLAPARPGEGLKKSTQTELSTRIKPDFSVKP
jgi:hypothetical protein